jgi:hypothetical protein
VDRTYSAYHHRVRNDQEARTFEEAVEQALEAQEARALGEGGETPVRGDGAGSDDSRHKHLSNSIYADYLQRWSEFFPREQMLVLNPKQTIKSVLDFLDLPDWEPGASPSWPLEPITATFNGPLLSSSNNPRRRLEAYPGLYARKC